MPKRKASQSRYSCKLTNDGSLCLSTEYEEARLIELLTAYALFEKSNNYVHLAQNSLLLKKTDDEVQWQSEWVLEEDRKDEAINLLTWYKEACNSQRFTKSQIKEAKATATKAVLFFRLNMPRVLDSILFAVIPACVQYGRGNQSQSIQELIRCLVSSLIENISVRKRHLEFNADLDAVNLPKPVSIEDGNVLAVGGSDGFGGLFSFSHSYVPLLNAMHLHIFLAFQSVLWIAESRIEETELSTDDVKRLNQQVDACCKRIIDTYARRAQEIFVYGIEQKIRTAIKQHFDESVARARLELDGTPFGEESGLFITQERNNARLIKRLISLRKQELKNILGAPGPGGDKRSKYKWGDQEKVSLNRYYLEYQAICTDAKSIYKTVSKYRTWRKIVKEELKDKYQDKELPDDIIECLSESDPYKWPASNLAIEIAARLSHPQYKPLSLSPRRLKAKLPKKTD